MDSSLSSFVGRLMTARELSKSYYWELIGFLSIFSGLNTEIALRKAKENVEKHYAVVGVLEELNKTLTVLEHYVPRFFKGAKDVYWSK